MEKPIFEAVKQLDDGTEHRCFVYEVNLDEVTEAFGEDDMHGLPLQWQKLQWHKLVDIPCLSGDTSYVALDRAGKAGYASHDGWCSTFRHDGDLTSFLRKQCLVTFGDLTVEDAGLIDEEGGDA